MGNYFSFFYGEKTDKSEVFDILHTLKLHNYFKLWLLNDKELKMYTDSNKNLFSVLDRVLIPDSWSYGMIYLNDGKVEQPVIMTSKSTEIDTTIPDNIIYISDDKGVSNKKEIQEKYMMSYAEDFFGKFLRLSLMVNDDLSSSVLWMNDQIQGTYNAINFILPTTLNIWSRGRELWWSFKPEVNKILISDYVPDESKNVYFWRFPENTFMSLELERQLEDNVMKVKIDTRLKLESRGDE